MMIQIFLIKALKKRGGSDAALLLLFALYSHFSVYGVIISLKSSKRLYGAYAAFCGYLIYCKRYEYFCFDIKAAMVASW